MTNIVERAVTTANVPSGYAIAEHQLRGYDSPDRWYVASRLRWRTEHATLEQAELACRKHRTAQRRKTHKAGRR